MARRPLSISYFFLLTPILLAIVFVFPLISQDAALGRHGRPQITSRIDETKLHRLAGNIRPEVNPGNDQGAVSDDFIMEHMMLQLGRTPEQEQALKQTIDALHDPKSPSYHHWLTAAVFVQTYSPAQVDIDSVTHWLEGHGF